MDDLKNARYLLHSSLGIIAIRALIDLGAPALAALAVAILGVLAASAAVALFLEPKMRSD